MTVSVAMAAYNGEKYIAEQIDSILPQLKDTDELVISLNLSTDRTEEIIRRYTDSRIKVVNCNKHGVLQNFENAIRNCSNDIIFLSDQDDIWVENKIETQLMYFEDSSVGGVCHGCRYIDDEGQLMDTQPVQGSNRDIRFIDILRKNPVQGSALAFRSELRELFLPFPRNIPMHDSWIGLCICKKSRLVYLCEHLLMYRQHEGTVTVREHQKIIKMVRDRISLITSYIMK